MVFPIKYGTIFSLKLVTRVVVLIFAISVLQSVVFAPMCFYVNDVLVEYRDAILFISNFYWTISTCSCYFVIIIAITLLSYSTAVNLKQSIKTAEKLRNKGPPAGSSRIQTASCSNQHVGNGFSVKEDNAEHSEAKSDAPPPSKLSPFRKFGSKLIVGQTKSAVSVSDIETEASGTPHMDAGKRKSKTMQRDLRLTKALLAVAIAYIVCCTPYTLFIVVFRLMPEEYVNEVSPTSQFAMKLFVKTLYLFNYVINPFTYLVFNEFFRNQISRLPYLSWLQSKPDVEPEDVLELEEAKPLQKPNVNKSRVESAPNSCTHSKPPSLDRRETLITEYSTGTAL